MGLQEKKDRAAFEKREREKREKELSGSTSSNTFLFLVALLQAKREGTLPDEEGIAEFAREWLDRLDRREQREQVTDA